MKFLVTGGKGFLGSHLSLRLLEEGHEVISYDLYDPKELNYLKDFKGYTSIVDTVMNESVLNRMVECSDAVFHLAAIAEPEQYVNYPRKTIDINLRASLNIIDRLIATNKMFFYSSTSEVYGKNPDVPFNENSDRLLGPTSINRWCYSTSKSMVEHYCNALHMEGILNFVGVRIFNAYGPRLRGRVLDKFINRFKNNQPLEIHGSGDQKRCYTYISDLIDAIMLLINEPNLFGTFYNVGNPFEEYSVSDLASLFCKAVGNPDYPISYIDRDSYGKSYEDPDRRIPDVTKITNVINWEPKVSLNEGLKLTLDYELGANK